ncbi:MAG TPA: ACT domain-containing protein [Solirubrobacterales bacterium]|nr:ACT domain-containing protein [Solirubrobacterales bacterium]
MGKGYFAIQAIGKDKPGLVAKITGVVCERFGCNIEGSAMTIVGGHFASTLIASALEEINEANLREALAAELELGLHVSPIAEADVGRSWREASHEVTVETVERHGLVLEISRVLFDHGMNINYLGSSCNSGRNSCTVVITTALPGSMRAKELEWLLEKTLPGDVFVDVKPVQAGSSEAP